MEIEVFNSMITLSKTEDLFAYSTRLNISVPEPITLKQITPLIDSFCELKEINSGGEILPNKRIIAVQKEYPLHSSRFSYQYQRVIKKYIAQIFLKNEICFDKFVCETDDFKTFKWYVKELNTELIKVLDTMKLTMNTMNDDILYPIN